VGHFFLDDRAALARPFIQRLMVENGDAAGEWAGVVIKSLIFL
jgi:hypothetical protein